MRKALVVGIDYYENQTNLSGAVNDARRVKALLERNADGTLNFPTPKLLVASGPDTVVSRRAVKESVRELFSGESEVALFYFAGHGYLEDTGGYLCLSDGRTGDDSMSLAEVMTLVNRSMAKSKIVILDCCHSGAAGAHPISATTELSDGVTILTASTADQFAWETGHGSGVFTELFIDAMDGAAANLLGAITPGSIYAHIDQALGPWAQRPVFKTNVKTFVSLRRTEAPIPFAALRQLTSLFTDPCIHLALDPTYEPERSGSEGPDIPPPDPDHTRLFATLQALARVDLVRPVGAPHMWHAAMRSGHCELTVIGQHYWRLLDKGLL